MELREYQKQAVQAGLELFRGDKYSGVLVLPTGCLAKGTPILMADGTYKEVEKLSKGDSILSFDNYSGSSVENEVDEVIRTSLNPKPMIEFVYENEKIKTTYDHPFFNGKGFYPLYQLIWGEMEESQRIQLKLLCEQYGQTFNHKTLRGLSSCCNETCSRCERLFKNDDGWKNDKGSQNSRRELAEKSKKTSSNQSYQWKEVRQSSGKFGMVYCEIQCLDWEENRKDKNSNTPKKLKIRGNKKKKYSKILFKEYDEYFKRRKKETLQYTSKKISTGNKTNSLQNSDCSIVVKEAEPYYSICMRRAPYTYHIGRRGNFITHNSGKSLVIASIAKELEGSTVVFQPNKEILEQNVEKMRQFGYNPHVFSASMNRKEIGNITFATIGSLYNKKQYWDYFDHIIIDECHLVNAKGGMYQEFIEYNRGSVLGLTATPYRLYSYNDFQLNTTVVVNKMLHRTRPRIFEDVIHVTQVKELYNQGYLCPIEYVLNSDYEQGQIKLNSTGKDFDDKSLKEYNKKMNIVQTVFDEVKNNKSNHILVFNVFVEEAEELSKNLNNIGIRSATVSARTPKKERQKILQGFRAGTIQVVTNVGVLTTGFDFPELDCVILSRPTQSVALYYQMCYTHDMEILTDRGFLPSTKIKIGDMVYGFDKDSSEIKLVPVLNKIVRDKYDFEKIMQYKSPIMDIGMSDFHDVISRSRNSKKWIKEPLKNALKRKDMWEVPVSGIEKKYGINITDDEIRFLGFFLSDGNINKKTKVITISQSERYPNIIKKIEDCLDGCNFKYNKFKVDINSGFKTKFDRYMFTISYGKPRVSDKDKTGWSRLEKFIDKNLNENYEEINERQFDLLLKYINFGDGKKSKISWKRKTYTIAMGDNKIYAERIQSLAIRRRYRANIYIQKKLGFKDQYILSLKKISYNTIAGINNLDGVIQKKSYKRTRFEEDKNYNKKLWCITNELGTVIVRRNGKVMIAGNCGRGIRIADRKEKLRVVDVCGNVKKFGKIEEFHIYGEGSKMRLKSDVSPLTGYDFYYGQDLEFTNYSGLVEKNSYGNMLQSIPFGKYKNLHITKVPTDYLWWCFQNVTQKNVVEMIKKELDRRR